MRTVTIKLYKFEELDAIAQGQAITNKRSELKAWDWTDDRVLAQIKSNPLSEYTSIGWKWDHIMELEGLSPNGCETEGITS